MAQLADLMRRANFSADGTTYIGKAVYESPELDFKTEEDSNSFLSVNQILGMNAMSTEVTLSEYAPGAMKLVNIANGVTVPFVFRGSYEDSQGNKISYKEEIEGKLSNVTLGDKKTQGKAETKMTVQIHKWKLFNNGELVYHIDQDHMIIDGVDQMAEHVTNAGG